MFQKTLALYINVSRYVEMAEKFQSSDLVDASSSGASSSLTSSGGSTESGVMQTPTTPASPSARNAPGSKLRTRSRELQKVDEVDEDDSLELVRSPQPKARKKATRRDMSKWNDVELELSAEYV